MAAIPLDTPEVVPAVPEKTYDLLWLSQVVIMANDPNRTVRVQGKIDKGRILEDGKTWELKPGGSTDVVINDFFAEAEKDPELATIMGMILSQFKTRSGL